MKQQHYTISSGRSLQKQLILKLIILLHQTRMSPICPIPLDDLPYHPPQTFPHNSFFSQQPYHHFIQVSLHYSGVDWLTFQDHAQQTQNYFQMGCSMTQLEYQLPQGWDIYPIRNEGQREFFQQLDALRDFKEVERLVVNLKICLVRECCTYSFQFSAFLRGCVVNFFFSLVYSRIDHNMNEQEPEQICEYITCSQHDSSSIFKMECMAAVFLPICLYLTLHIYDISIVASSRPPYYFSTIDQASLADDQILVARVLFDLKEGIVQHPTAPSVFLANPNQFYYSSRLDIDTYANWSILYGAGLFLFLLVIGMLIDHAKGEYLGDIPSRFAECNPKVRNGLKATPSAFTFARVMLITSVFIMFAAVLSSEIFSVVEQPSEQYRQTSSGTYQALINAESSGIKMSQAYVANVKIGANLEMDVVQSIFPYYTIPQNLYTDTLEANQSLWNNAFIRQALQAGYQNETKVLNYLADNYNCFMNQNYIGYSNFYAGAFGNNAYVSSTTHKCEDIINSVNDSHSSRLSYKIGILFIVTFLIVIALFLQCKCCRPQQEESPTKAKLILIMEATVLYLGHNDLIGLEELRGNQD